MNSRPDQILKAFADPTRLRILFLLGKGELCVCDLMSALKLPQPKVSRHLSYLRRAGLVTHRKEKMWVYYALAKPAGRFHERLLSCLDSCINEAPVFAKDASALKGLKRSGPVCC